jgi:hypothetical protein
MRSRMVLFGLFCGFVIVLASCGTGVRNDDVIVEGVIYFVEYSMENGQTGGFTRLNNSVAVPGRNGSWNIDAYGQLTRDYLIITRPQRKDLGPRIIPAHRLVDIQFGDGGIKTVDENKPA